MTDPIDETRPNQTAPPEPPATPERADAGPGPADSPGAAATPASGGPALRVDPDRPSDPGWREPAWFPPRDEPGRSVRRERRSGTVATVAGLILIAVGAWYFLQTTLGFDLPQVRWSSLWPVVLIAIGGVILVRSIQRRP